MKRIASALMFAAVLSLTGCDEPAQQVEKDPEMVYTNSYEYGDDSYDIKSVVRFETETTVELWLSPKEGLNTIGSVIENGNYGVISINRTYLGSRDLFQKSGSYASFNDMMFDKGNNGRAYIEMSFSADSVYFDFKVETLYAAGVPTEKAFAGNYKGTFTEHEQDLSNQWSFNRIVKAITGGKVFVNTDAEYNTTTKLSLYDDEAFMHEAVSLTIPEERLGEMLTDIGDVIEVTYDAGKTYELTSSANINKLTFGLVDDNASLIMDLANGTDFLAADYLGAVELHESKPNHIACTVYEKNSEGEFEEIVTRRNPIHKLFVKAQSSSTAFYFGMSEASDADEKEMYPTLSFETRYMDGKYYFEDKAIGRFKYSDDFNTISDQPFGGDAPSKATMRIEQISNTNYKIILRVKDLLISSSKKADVEVFYEGSIN